MGNQEVIHVIHSKTWSTTVYIWGCPPSQDSSGKMQFCLGEPLRKNHPIILVLTVTGRGGGTTHIIGTSRYWNGESHQKKLKFIHRLLVQLGFSKLPRILKRLGPKKIITSPSLELWEKSVILKKDLLWVAASRKPLVSWSFLFVVLTLNYVPWLIKLGYFSKVSVKIRNILKPPTSWKILSLTKKDPEKSQTLH